MKKSRAHVELYKLYTGPAFIHLVCIKLYIHKYIYIIIQNILPINPKKLIVGMRTPSIQNVNDKIFMILQSFKHQTMEMMDIQT